MTENKNTKPQTVNWFVDKLSLYQAANSDNAAIKNNFVIRQAEFEIIVSSIRSKADKDPVQHELILGRRGSGKSTLLRRIQAEIEENKTLQKNYIAVNLAEEQAGIYRLFDLWEEVLKELSIKLGKPLELKEYGEFDNDQAYTRYLYTVIHETLIKYKKKVVLLLDNFDRIVGNFSDDGHLLRETLLNYNDIQLVAGSTRMDEHFWQYDQPFYEFFRRHRLEALSTKEIIELLNHWSHLMELPQLAVFAKNNIGKIEAIRILTDGLPRTLQFFIQILLQNSDLYGYEYLRKVMDNVTTLYQERLNNLPAAQRKIIAEMAFIWEACATKELVEKCRMESKLISANIKQLSNAGIIDTITTDKKNHLYRISERFFNMWLIVTQGNPEQKRKAKWLSIFLESWYDAAELQQLTSDHISNLKNKKLGYDKAMVFTKAFAQSRYTTTAQRDELLGLTMALQPKNSDFSLLALPQKYADLENDIVKLIEEENFNAAHQLVSEIENEADGIKFFIEGYIFAEEQKFAAAEKYYLLAIEKGHLDALNNLAVLYKKQQKFTVAEKYYLLAIEKGDVNATINLASLYDDQQKFAKAENYYLLAIERGNTTVIIYLAILYKDQQKFAEAEKYYLLAIEKGDVNAIINLASLYDDQQKFAEAENYYLLAIEKGDEVALNNLAILFEKQEKFAEAEKYWIFATEKGDVNAIYNLGILYNSQEKFAEAENYWLFAIEKGDINALFNLANLYHKQQKFAEAENYYLTAIEKGHIGAFNNLAILYEEQQKFEEAEEYWLLGIEKDDLKPLYNLAILYYNRNVKKPFSLHLISTYNTKTKGDVKGIRNQIIVEVWNGIFENLQNEITALFKESNYDNLNWFFEQLLIQEQLNLVFNLFTDAEHGPELQKRYAPLYYAVLLLNNKTENNLTLRIPPEIMPTVNEIIDSVKKGQQFYSLENEAVSLSKI